MKSEKLLLGIRAVWRSTQALALVLLLLALLPETCQAQRRKPALGGGSKKQTPKPTQSPNAPAPQVTPQRAAAKNAKSDANGEFAPEDVEMSVEGEGVQLMATWFPPINKDKADDKKKSNAKEKPNDATEPAADDDPGKSTAAFILVHDWGRSRSDMLALGQHLQSLGHAVIIPDLRGHGDSVDVLGMKKKLDHQKFRKSDMASAVGDIQQCKRFLEEKNNEGILNIDLLNIVAVGDSAHLAIAWSMNDWSLRPVIGVRQGQDVKSIVLFSPSSNFAGSSLRKLVKEPFISGRNASPLPMLIVWGAQSDAADDCAKFVQTMRKFRPEASGEDSLAERWAKQNLFDIAAPTAMRGFELAGNTQASHIWDFTNNFVSQKVLAFEDQFPWQIRGAEAMLEARQKLEGSQPRPNR